MGEGGIYSPLSPFGRSGGGGFLRGGPRYQTEPNPAPNTAGKGEIFSEISLANWAAEGGEGDFLSRPLPAGPSSFSVGGGLAPHPPLGMGTGDLVNRALGPGELEGWVTTDRGWGGDQKSSGPGLRNPGSWKVWVTTDRGWGYQKSSGPGPGIRKARKYGRGYDRAGGAGETHFPPPFRRSKSSFSVGRHTEDGDQKSSGSGLGTREAGKYGA